MPNDNTPALVEALELCLTGGNLIAGLLIDKLGPGFAERWPPDTDYEIALHSLHATDNYELWCCWAAIMRARDLRDAALSQPQPLPREGDWVTTYDAGLLSDYGGGNVEWWQDYIRSELGRAHEHYASQIAAPASPPAKPQTSEESDA